MHATARDYCIYWLNGLGPCHRTLDVGSYDVNGNVRSNVVGTYIGVDLRAGPNVDIVALSSELPFLSNSMDRVICLEMLEHDTYPWLSMAEMARVLKPGGFIILTCRGYDESGCTPIHDYPNDYWRYSPGAIEHLFLWADLNIFNMEPDRCGMPGILSVAKKSP